MSIVACTDLVRRFGEVTALDGVSFDVRQGEIFGIIGPNGAGKTTLLNCAEGLDRQDSGTISVLGLDPSSQADALALRVGVQLQTAALPPRLKVAEVMRLFSAFYEEPTPWRDLLATLGIASKASARVEKLSGGERQRVFIALALLHKPDVVFLDELTTGLDPQARLAMWEVVEDIRDRGTTVVLTTHFMDEAERLCDRVAIIDHGRIIALDSVPALIREHAGDAQLRLLFEGRPADDLGLDRIRAVTAVHREGKYLVVQGAGWLPSGRRHTPLGGRSALGGPPGDVARSGGRVPQPDRTRDEDGGGAVTGYRALVAAFAINRVREPVGLFFAVFFAPLLVVIFGLIFGNEPSPDFGGVGYLDATLAAYTSVVLAIVGVMLLPINHLEFRESGALRRLRLTPMRPSAFLAADLNVTFVVSLVGIVLALGVGAIVFGVDLPDTIGQVLLAAALGLLAFLALGYALAGLYPSQAAATGIGNVLLILLMMSSGAFVPMDVLSDGVRTAFAFSPTRQFVVLVEGLWAGEPWSTLLVPTAVLIGMIAVLGPLGIVFFRRSMRVYA